MTSYANELAILYEALHARIGIEVTAGDLAALKRRLYAAKREDPALASIQIRTSPYNPDSHLWITKAGTIPKASADEQT